MKKIKKILAILMVIFLISLYVWSFVAALQARPEANEMFWAAVFTTIFLPILLHIFIWTAEWLRGRGVDKEASEEKTEEKK